MQEIDLHMSTGIHITEVSGAYEIRGYYEDDLRLIETVGAVEIDGTKIQLEPNGQFTVLSPEDGIIMFSIDENDTAILTRS